MANTWSLQDAKSHFSEVFERVLSDSPQEVTRRGKESIVLVSQAEYSRLIGVKQSFCDFLLSVPKTELQIERNREFARNIDL